MKNIVKVLMDIVLALTFVLLFNTRVPGLTFHEVAGLGIGLGILVHILLNLRWVKEVSLKIFSPKLPLKTRLGYLLNTLLLLSFAAIIVSGIFISKILFPNLSLGNNGLFRTLHVSLSYLTLILIGVHIGLHGKWLLGFCKNLCKIKSSKTTSLLAKLAVLLILVFGGYQIAATNFIMEISGLGNVFTTGGSGGMANGFAHGYQGRNQNSEQSPTDVQEISIDSQAISSGDQQSTVADQQSAANDQQFPNGRQHRNGGGRGFGNRPGAHSQNGESSGSNLFEIIGGYLGIVGFFAILTYYVEKFIKRRA